jgi:hypothetical protein
MRAAARDAWDRQLGRIRVDGGTDAQKRIFYTALYHTMVVPNTFSDADGRYMGFDDQVHQTHGWTQYANFSGWDVYRSWFPLMSLAAPDVANDFAQSLVVDGEQGGALPKWSPLNDESAVMVGDPGAASVASAYAFGARGFDTASALRLMLRSALQPGTKSNDYVIRPGLKNYLDRGFIPLGDPDGPWGPPSTTLEYGSADYAIASFAHALGDQAHAKQLEEHSQNWQNLFNPGTGYIQPRNDDGSFATPFDPGAGTNYVEGNAAQYTWLVPHNAAGLIAALGGEGAAGKRLDDYFTKLNAGPNQPYAFMGNEPSFNDAWLYNWVGQPWKTQAIARRTTVELFRDEPGGLVGNDDLGASSGWHVWGAMGLYPVIPGVGGFAVGSPLFQKITITMPSGRPLVITGDGAAADHPYVQSLALNGRKTERTWLTWNELRNGGSLDFALGAQATDWAARYRPPSYQRGQVPAIGYADPAGVFLQPGGSSDVRIGVQNLSSRQITVTWNADLPPGVTIEPADGQLVVPAGAKREATVHLVASADAPDGAKTVDLGLQSSEGTMPPVIERVVVARRGNLAPYFNNDGTSRDSHPSEANYDLVGWSLSADALAAQGVTPGGTVSADGFTYRWPDAQPGTPDNIISGGQQLFLEPVSGASRIGFLGSATNGPSKGTGTITYTDGTKQPFALGMSDWTLGGGGGQLMFGNVKAITLPYRNSVGGPRDPVTTYLFSQSVDLEAGKTVDSVTLPDDIDQGNIHIHAIAQQ